MKDADSKPRHPTTAERAVCEQLPGGAHKETWSELPEGGSMRDRQSPVPDATKSGGQIERARAADWLEACCEEGTN